MKVPAALLVCALATGTAAQTDLPFEVGGPFTLTDHNGQIRTQADPDGNPQLLFFGYANCPGICTSALPLMGDMAASLDEAGIIVRPVMITVDPARDTVDTMKAPLTDFHPEFIGLTGDAAALDAAYKAFSVDHALAYEDPEYGPVYSHGSFIYLMDDMGEVLTLIPPIADGQKAIDIALKYLTPQG